MKGIHFFILSPKRYGVEMAFSVLAVLQVNDIILNRSEQPGTGGRELRSIPVVLSVPVEHGHFLLVPWLRSGSVAQERE